MRTRDQSLEELIASLGSLDVEWMDDTARGAIARLEKIPKKTAYERADIIELLEKKFSEGLLCARLFLGLSKDNMEAALKAELGKGGTGKMRYVSNPENFLTALEKMGLLSAMTAAINRQPLWSDVLVERLRSGRGSAISGQKRGRGLEDFVEALVKAVFPENYETRCLFTGADGKSAKCDFAVPSRVKPRIVIEAKGYGATGSKMSDIIGDLDAIISAKRHDTTFLFVTDGMSWNSRISDLRKIVERQNQGKIARIYTTSMRKEFLADLESLSLAL